MNLLTDREKLFKQLVLGVSPVEMVGCLIDDVVADLAWINGTPGCLLNDYFK